jgi:exonuclease VII small subunit
VSDFGSLADRLESIVEDLDEMAFDRLREAVAEGATVRPQSDKELTKARRAVEKAAHILRNMDQP